MHPILGPYMAYLFLYPPSQESFQLVDDRVKCLRKRPLNRVIPDVPPVRRRLYRLRCTSRGPVDIRPVVQYTAHLTHQQLELKVFRTASSTLNLPSPRTTSWWSGASTIRGPLTPSTNILILTSDYSAGSTCSGPILSRIS